MEKLIKPAAFDGVTVNAVEQIRKKASSPQSVHKCVAISNV